MTSKSEPADEIMPNVFKTDPRYRSIYLLQELHNIKKETGENYIQKFRKEMIQKFSQDQEELQTEDSAVYSNIMDVTKKIPDLIRDLKYIDSFQKNDVQESIAAVDNKSEFTEILSTEKLNCEQIRDFSDLLNSVSKLYAISSDEDYFEKSSKLSETLDLLKDYEMSSQHSNKLEKKYNEIHSLITTLFE